MHHSPFGQSKTVIREVGRKIQRDAGRTSLTGDFGIDLVAGKAGVAFPQRKPGHSHRSNKETPNWAIQTFQTIVIYGESLTKEHWKATFGGQRRRRQKYQDALPKIAEIQEKDKIELHLAVREGRQTPGRSVSGTRGLETLKSLESVEFRVGSRDTLREAARIERHESERKGKRFTLGALP